MSSSVTEKNLTTGPDLTWPKDFHELKLIDDSLRCGICYDYIKTCMVTPCAHSYCSICIRRSLLYKTACPTCFEEIFETSLRNNRVLDRVAELFVSIKDRLIKHLRIAAIHFNCNQQLQSPAPSQTHPLQKSTLTDATPKRNIQKPVKSSSTKGKFNCKTVSSYSSSSKKSDISKRLEDILGSPVTNKPISRELDCLVSENEVDFKNIPTVPSMFLQPKVESEPRLMDVLTVSCPICDVAIPERNINVHLDNCLANVDQPPVKSPLKSKQKRNPLSKMVWSIMAEKDLRKKLKDYGLNSQGDKKTLISRIQRYTILYNSECDSDNPRPVSEIIRQVEREEKQPPVQNQQRLVLNSKSDPKIIQEENKKYIKENKDSFMKLIEAMKEREGRSIRPLRPSNRICSDDEDFDDNKKHVDVSKLSVTKSNEIPSTSTVVRESIDLCDSNEGESSLSPVLGLWKTSDNALRNEFVTESCDDVLLPNSRVSESNKNNPKTNKVSSDSLIQMTKVHKSVDTELFDNSCSNSPDRYSATPSMTPSPSCIINNHTSDSEDSISLLINQTIAEDDLQNATEAVTENYPACNSQLEDPDFVLTEQPENENCSEEEFIPRRKSKRKYKSTSLSDSSRNRSPPCTRRRLKK